MCGQLRFHQIENRTATVESVFHILFSLDVFRRALSKRLFAGDGVVDERLRLQAFD